MASDKNFVEYAAEQLGEISGVTYRKMFGEYMLYADGKPVVLICDNNCFVKILPETTELMPDASQGYPYEGAKIHYLLDIDDRDLAVAVVKKLIEVTPIPKKKR